MLAAGRLVADLLLGTPVLPGCCFAADTLVFSSVAVVSIASLNLSLLVNSVGLYQVGTVVVVVVVWGGGARSGEGGGAGERGDSTHQQAAVVQAAVVHAAAVQ